MEPSLPDRVRIETDGPLRAPFDDKETSRQEVSASLTDSFFEDNSVPTKTMTYRRHAPSVAEGDESTFFDFTDSVGDSDKTKKPKGWWRRIRKRRRGDPWTPKLVQIIRHPLTSFSFFFARVLAWLWVFFLRGLAWSWRILWIVLRAPFIWIRAIANRLSDAIVWRVTGMLSSDHGGRNYKGGFRMTDKIVLRVKYCVAGIFSVFCLWIVWFYVSSLSTGVDEAFVDLPRGLFFSVPKRASWEEYANHSLSCTSGAGEAMETWLATNASCQESRCLRLGDLADWLVERTLKDDLNFAASTFIPRSHVGNISVPCACAIRLKNGTGVFFMDPLATIYGTEKGKITDAVPVLGIRERTRIVPRSVALSFTRWPSDGKKIVRDKVILSDEDASVALWCVTAVTKKQMELK